MASSRARSISTAYRPSASIVVIRTGSLRTKVSVAGKWNFHGGDKDAEAASKRSRVFFKRRSLGGHMRAGCLRQGVQ
jgi:hypothetical protein